MDRRLAGLQMGWVQVVTLTVEVVENLVEAQSALWLDVLSAGILGKVPVHLIGH